MMKLVSTKTFIFLFAFCKSVESAPELGQCSRLTGRGEQSVKCELSPTAPVQKSKHKDRDSKVPEQTLRGETINEDETTSSAHDEYSSILKTRNFMEFFDHTFIERRVPLFTDTSSTFLNLEAVKQRCRLIVNLQNGGYAVVDALDDDVFHVHFTRDTNMASLNPKLDLPASEMVSPSGQFFGPTECLINRTPGKKPLTVSKGWRIRTDTSEARVSAETGCVYMVRANDILVCKICPTAGFPLEPFTMLLVSTEILTNAYGMGQWFMRINASEGDLFQNAAATGPLDPQSEFGHRYQGIPGVDSRPVGANARVQVPALVSMGNNDSNGNLMAASFLFDSPQKQIWDFSNANEWKMVVSPLEHFELFVGMANAPMEARRHLMRISGRPPIPPRKSFGLWLSEFGIKSWKEADSYIKETRNAGFPLDGIFLDLLWFGGIKRFDPNSPMGSFQWDKNKFPSPKKQIQKLKESHIGVVAIEEPFVAVNTPNYLKMKDMRGFAHPCGDPSQATVISEWMGSVSPIDWSNRNATLWWHWAARIPNLVDAGVMGHWTDLGEPEYYSADSCYSGLHASLNRHKDIHNIYNLLWLRSIHEGYKNDFRVSNGKFRQRPWQLARAGAAGIQRYGGMWSGDVGARLDVLATQMNVQMHMNAAGVDYYSSDVGGYWRLYVRGDTAETIKGSRNEDSVFTQWLVVASWVDLPGIRIHLYNCGFDWIDDGGCPYEISPAKVGHVPSNLFNIRNRYTLIPYYYSLAYLANQQGLPMVSSPALHFPQDLELRNLGDQKMIGPHIMVGTVHSHGQISRSLHLPRGRWIDYYTGYMLDRSSGGRRTGSLRFVDPSSGILRLPAFVRAGGIIPIMHVTRSTLDAFNHQKNGTLGKSALVLRIFLDEERTSFPVYEDDGESVANYTANGEPLYEGFVSVVQQQLQVWKRAANNSEDLWQDDSPLSGSLNEDHEDETENLINFIFSPQVPSGDAPIESTLSEGGYYRRRLLRDGGSSTLFGKIFIQSQMPISEKYVFRRNYELHVWYPPGIPGPTRVQVGVIHSGKKKHVWTVAKKRKVGRSKDEYPMWYDGNMTNVIVVESGELPTTTEIGFILYFNDHKNITKQPTGFRYEAPHEQQYPPPVEMKNLYVPPCFEVDTDLAGSDIEGQRNVESALDCQKLCVENSKCRFFTYRADLAMEDLRCWLKSSDDGRKNTLAMLQVISGPANCRDQARGYCEYLNGVYSSEENFSCCPQSCKVCGGVGCENRDGGADSCCSKLIVDKKQYCRAGYQPPCLLS